MSDLQEEIGVFFLRRLCILRHHRTGLSHYGGYLHAAFLESDGVLDVNTYWADAVCVVALYTRVPEGEGARGCFQVRSTVCRVSQVVRAFDAPK